MSRFSEAFAAGGEGLMHATADRLVYWPGGVEADALEIEIILTVEQAEDAPGEYGVKAVAKAEAQVWANGLEGVAEPQLKVDLIVQGTTLWRVMRKIETVAGMHRLGLEQVERAVVGRGRGR